MQPGWKYSVLCTPAKRALNGHTTHLSTRQTGVPKHLVLLLTCLQGTKHQDRFANTFFVGCIIVTNGSIFCALSTGGTGYRHSQTGAQASAVSCYQSLQSRSSRDKISWSHRGACTSEVWLPHTDFMVLSLCCAIQVPVATAALEGGCCSQPTREDAASGLQRKETSGLPQKMCPQTDRPVVQTGLDLSSASGSWPITLGDFGSWKMTWKITGELNYLMKDKIKHIYFKPNYCYFDRKKGFSVCGCLGLKI